MTDRDYPPDILPLLNYKKEPIGFYNLFLDPIPFKFGVNIYNNKMIRNEAIQKGNIDTIEDFMDLFFTYVEDFREQDRISANHRKFFDSSSESHNRGVFVKNSAII